MDHRLVLACCFIFLSDSFFFRLPWSCLRLQQVDHRFDRARDLVSTLNFDDFDICGDKIDLLNFNCEIPVFLPSTNCMFAPN